MVIKYPPYVFPGIFTLRKISTCFRTLDARALKTRAGGTGAGCRITSERANKIRTQARTARELNAVARSWQPIDLHATKNSLLLEAVDIARLASNDLEGEFADKKKKRAGILALFKKNEEMVEDLMAHLEEVGDGVDVVACTDEKEYVEKLVSLKLEDRCFGRHRQQRDSARAHVSSTDNSKKKM